MANDSSVNLKPLKTFKLLGETVEMVVTGAMTGKHSFHEKAVKLF
jgi:hypothetical protein